MPAYPPGLSTGMFVVIVALLACWLAVHSIPLLKLRRRHHRDEQSPLTPAEICYETAQQVYTTLDEWQQPATCPCGSRKICVLKPVFALQATATIGPAPKYTTSLGGTLVVLTKCNTCRRVQMYFATDVLGEDAVNPPHAVTTL